MRIVYLSNATSVHFIRWYEYFIERGHEVFLISGNTSLFEYKGVKTDHIKGFKVYYLPEFRISNRIVSFGINFFTLPRIFLHLKKLLTLISPDIIHAHQIYPYGFWGALSSFHPFILTPMGSDVVILANKYYVYGKLARFALKKANLVTGDSIVVKESCENLGMKGCYHLIQNGVDLTKFAYMENSKYNIIRKKYNISETTTLIFYSRAFTPLYNIDMIIKSIPLILKKIPDCKLMLAHHFGNIEKNLRKLVCDFNIGKSVIFTGTIQHTDMPLYYQAADLSISVPSSDNSPSSVYEAMACGVPTVISNLAWTKYAMKNGHNTFIIDEVSDVNIADAVLQLLDNTALRTKIIRGGLETVKKYFCYRENMRKMEDLMMEIF